MKKRFLTIVLGLGTLTAMAQEKMTCCLPSATEKFASFASEKTFIMSHQEPLPFIYDSPKGQDIAYKTADGTDAHAWEVKADKSTSEYLFVIHEWWGLNDYIKQESERLSNELGINVIALDLYDKQVASTREDAGKYMQSVKTERAVNIIKGAFDYVGSNAKVFTIGWCFGGGWSLQAAIIGGKQVDGCVMYYGMPEKDQSRLKMLNCDVIGFFAKKDQWINEKVVGDFEQNMKDVGKKATVYEYDAEHAFANPSNPIYNKEAADDAHSKAVAFIKQRMK
ncbi:MAG TPA: dienelactone hydrolase family protein [Panacibacter sp.]|nr:dienelactone hydrolase family protein [Panacibacter sp.]HNP46754.1 dienelactone hydrolase family protein [Panacibacter sp.]